MPLPDDAVSVEEMTTHEQIAIPEVTGARGPQGWAAEFQVTATHIQWRTTNPLATDWTDLVALAALEGPEGPVGPAPELRVAGGWIQWREPEGVWKNLLAVSTLVGADGRSAFEVAQDAGFAGTEAQWLADLVGPQGDAATIAVGTVTSVPNGQPASVSNSGSPNAAVLDFEIPEGEKGEPGSNGTGWTGAAYDPETGTVTFTSADGLGFTTGDLRGQDGADGIGVPDPTGATDGSALVISGGEWTIGDPAGGGGGGGGATRATVTHTTAALAAAASEDFTLMIGATFVLRKITTDVTCRIRLYASSAQRTADEGRSPEMFPEGDHGCFIDAVIDTTDSATLNVIPAAFVATEAGSVYARVTNLSGVASAIEVTLDTVTLEA